MGAATKTPRSNNTPKKPGSFGGSFPKKPQSKPNASILNFFKKTDKPEDSLFFGGGVSQGRIATAFASASASASASGATNEDLYSADERFNEIETPVKKRRCSPEPDSSTKDEEDLQAPAASRAAPKNGKSLIRAPFILDSESEGEEDNEDGHEDTTGEKDRPPMPQNAEEKNAVEAPEPTDDNVKLTLSPDAIPIFDTRLPTPIQLKHEETSHDSPDDFKDIGDCMEADDDLFEGEEMREMRFMREQARLEAEEAGNFSTEDYMDENFDDGTVATGCPICGGNMATLSTDDATRHVNSCLDGNPTPLPNPNEESPPKAKKPEDEDVKLVNPSKQFLARSTPKPPQVNPFESAPRSGGVSAFSKLMSNNVEDSAWATAAASEKASRGKPAYERTCPFYKIMPGFSICVDAFRYNAIEGCKAYFLSHFHSDHYIGLTARWRHGPIYCSKVTGSLVRSQLGTAEKWVVEIEFDKEYDIPGTDGATVTMIPANHCPGSSLFLFQKKMGKGSSTNVKRILHCGDFRACPDHIHHPLLKPEVRDAVSGKVKQQKIDICYLDTTYLNPRYSFPPQEDVIKASAELCASISPDPNNDDTVLETDTADVSKYFQKEKKKLPSQGRLEIEGVKKPKPRLLVICGTYSIGKERICVAIAKALNSKIYATPAKIKICKQLDMPELTERLTSNPLEAQVHMQMLMEIRAETLQEYLNGYKPHFSRIVGFRPSGWNFRPVSGKGVPANTPPSTISTQQILHSKGWRTRFGHRDFTPQRGSTKEAMCFGVPYSEHSSFRELAMFVMGLRIDKIVPTVNVGSEQSRTRMKAWNDRWISERRKYGLVTPLVEGRDDDRIEDVELWEGKPSKGGGAWW